MSIDLCTPLTHAVNGLKTKGKCPPCWLTKDILFYRKEEQAKLQDILTAIIVKNDEVNNQKMNYYQGMNDVAAVFQLTLDQNLAFYCTDVASRCQLRDHLQLPFDEGLIPLFQLVFHVLEQEDP